MVRQPFDPSLVKSPERKAARTPDGRLSVSQVTSLVKEAIESALPATLHVVGEISNLKRHSSGHLYLTLKDPHSELSCVMWQSAATKLKFEPKDGMEVVATGSVEVFRRAGRYQLYIRKLEPVGIGALELAFRQLCERLSREGLFDESNKKKLPVYPQRIAIITSPTGAAIGDMLRTIERRYPCVHVLVYPVKVQGDGAAREIAGAIEEINANQESLEGVDLMIVGRGGGSLEDLWAFNEEIVARAIHASKIPIVSAVGHEIDVTIADMVADMRAATPTAAAELAVPVLEDLLDELSSQRHRLFRSLRSILELAVARLSAVAARSPFRDPTDFVRQRKQHVDELASRTQRRVAAQAHTARQRLDYLESVVQRIAPHALLRDRAVRLHDNEKRIHWAMANCLANSQRLMNAFAGRLERTSPAQAVSRSADDLEHLHEKLIRSMRHQFEFRKERLRRQSQRLSALSYQSVLRRGYSITRIKKGREIVRSLAQLSDRQRIVTKISDGSFESDVVNFNQLELFE